MKLCSLLLLAVTLTFAVGCTSEAPGNEQAGGARQSMTGKIKEFVPTITMTETQTATNTSTATTTQTATVTQTGTQTATSTVTRTGSAPGIYQQIYTFTGIVTSTGTAIVYYASWPHAQGNTATATTSQFAPGTGVATVTRTVISPFNSTETKTASATVSGSGTSTGTATVTVTATVTTSTTNAGTGTRTVSATGIATGTAIQTWTATWTTQVTQTVTNTTTSTETLTQTSTATGTTTAVLTNTVTSTVTVTNTNTGSLDGGANDAPGVDGGAGVSIPCGAMANAITATIGNVTLMVNSGAIVDSYTSGTGPYGGSNIGVNGNIVAAGAITNNGGVIKGRQSPNQPSNLVLPTIPATSINLPIGSSSPGSVNINGLADSITLAPGTYVVQNMNVNFPGAIDISAVGEVTVFVIGSLNLGGNENLNGIPANLTFVVTEPGWVNVNSNGTLVGNIYAPTSGINVNSTVFGSVVGGSVTLNSGAAVHFDNSLVCDPSSGGPVTIAPRPPRTLPIPPKVNGCYQGTANGWVQIPCMPAGVAPVLAIGQDEIDVPGGTPPALPIQFGQVETIFTAFDSESDSQATPAANQFSVQGNTSAFWGKNGDNDWVQFGLVSSNTQTSIFIQSWDLSIYYGPAKSTCTARCSMQCGCTTFGTGITPTTISNRSTALGPFDFAAVAGSVFNDDSGNPKLGMVAQFSWYDPKNDPKNNRGLYAIVADDQYGLASHWTGFSGGIVGHSDSSVAQFKNSSVLTRTLAGSCAKGTSPVSGIPWPGTCSNLSALKPVASLNEVNGTGESSNLCRVGKSTPLVAANSNLVYSESITAISDSWKTCADAACLGTATHLYVKSTDEDTGTRPINLGTQPFWESPDLFLVPKDSPVDVDAVASETLITPDGDFSVWVRVNNDFGCSDVNGAKAMVYIADPSALSTSWFALTAGDYSGGSNPFGVIVPKGKRALIGPFSFKAPSTVLGDGHKCILAAITADGQGESLTPTDPLSSYQVAQRNVQFSNCKLPLTNATLSDGNVVLTISADGAIPSLTGSNNLSVTFDDPTKAFYTTWGVKAGTDYTVSESGGQTKVVLGQPSIDLDPISIAAGQSVTASASVVLGSGQPTTKLQIQATLTLPGKTVNNGVTCVKSAPLSPPGSGGAGGGGGGGNSGAGGRIIAY
jgi:hypothetical protein